MEDRGWVAAGSHSGAVKGAELAEFLLQKVSEDQSQQLIQEQQGLILSIVLRV